MADPTSADANRDDEWLVHLVQMFGFLNACGIAADTEPDEAHDPINKNKIFVSVTTLPVQPEGRRSLLRLSST